MRYNCLNSWIVNCVKISETMLEIRTLQIEAHRLNMYVCVLMIKISFKNAWIFVILCYMHCFLARSLLFDPLENELHKNATREQNGATIRVMEWKTNKKNMCVTKHLAAMVRTVRYLKFLSRIGKQERCIVCVCVCVFCLLLSIFCFLVTKMFVCPVVFHASHLLH